MNICLLTRYFDMEHKEGVGIGRESKGLKESLQKNLNLNISTISTKGTGLISYFFYSTLEIPLRLLKEKVDIFHALTPIEGIWLPRGKSVVTYNDLFQITSPQLVGGGMGYNKLKLLIGKNFFEMACRLSSTCRGIVCISNKTANEVNQILKVNSKKIKVIRIGIRDDLKPLPKRDTILRIGYLGMLDKRKRVIKVIEAFKDFPTLQAELVIAGTGLDEVLLKTAASSDSRIKFLGYIKNGNLLDFFNSLNYFVFPTAMEGYGLPIVEAMACRKPVIVLKDSLIPEEVKERCIAVESYKDLFYELLKGNTPTSPKSSEDNYIFAKSHNWETTTNEYLKLYREISNE